MGVRFLLLVIGQQLVKLWVFLEELSVVLGLLLLCAPKGKAFSEQWGEALKAGERLVDGVVPQGVDVLEQLVAEIDLT